MEASSGSASARASASAGAAAISGNYVFCTLLGTGMPWSDQNEGMYFIDWANVCFQCDAAQLFAWVDPGGQPAEFTTAASTRAGSNALAKPRSACSQVHPPGLKPCPGARLSLRNVRSRLDGGRYDADVGYRPANLSKLWLVVDANQPLIIEAADRETFFRPRPDTLHGVFASETDQALVTSACLAHVKTQQDELTRQLSVAAKTKNQGLFQTGQYLNALERILNW